MSGSTVLAHIGYGGRDFGSFTGLTPASVSITNQAVTGNFGWADAADGNLGDSHKGRAFRFHLDRNASVTVSVAANPSATATSIGGLLPGFSIYQGLAAIAPFAVTQTSLPSSPDHDFADASVAWRTSWAQANLGLSYDATATGGSWNALGSWKIGGDGDLPGDFSQLSSFTFKAFGLDFNNDGIADKTTLLGPGDYTLFVGGNDLANQSSANAGLPYGLSATVSVAPVPEPAAITLLVAGAGLLTWVRRRSNA